MILIINLITIFLVALISVIYFKIKKFIKNSYRIKEYEEYYRVARSNEEFVKDFSLGILAGAILGLFAAPNGFVAIICFISIFISGISALKANYVYCKNKEKIL